MTIRCSRCGVAINEYDVQYIFDEPYCQRCYDEVLPEVERCSACGKEIDEKYTITYQPSHSARVVMMTRLMQL